MPAVPIVPTLQGSAMEQTPSRERMPDSWCARHFDHLSPELAATMPQTLAHMRQACPVAHSDQHGGFWVVTGYEDVLDIAQDWATYSSAHGLSIPAAPTAVRSLPVEADPPEQRLYKRLINPYFTPMAVARWEEATRALVTRLIDEFIEAGECDFMSAFARPYPALSFFDVALGAPADDVEKVAYLASKSSTPNDPEAAECWLGLANWIREFVADRRAHPREGGAADVVDAVLDAEIDGRPITEEEIVGTIQLLILGGLETTAGALGLMFVRFCAEPDIPALLRRSPELIPKAVEELLRLEPPFISVGRTAMRDTELHGRQLRKGDKVLISWASANRDASEFPAADSFDVTRGRNRHLAFGAGPHRCAGSNLARLNLRIALEELLRRLPEFALAGGAQVRFHSTLTRSPLELPITFPPGRREGP